MEQARIIAALAESFGFVARPQQDGPQRRLWERASLAIDTLPHALAKGEDVTHSLRVIAFACGQLPGGADAQGCAGCLASHLGLSLFRNRAA